MWPAGTPALPLIGSDGLRAGRIGFIYKDRAIRRPVGATLVVALGTIRMPVDIVMRDRSCGSSLVDFTAPVAIPNSFPDEKEDCSDAQHYRSDIICRGQQITEKPRRLIEIDRKAVQSHKKRPQHDQTQSRGS